MSRSLSAKIRSQWEDLKKSPPGKRFQTVYKKRKSESTGHPVKKYLGLVLGVVICAVGIFLLPAPGPGMIVLAIGLVLMAGESLTVARFLDWAELKTRPLYLWTKKKWKRFNSRQRLAIMMSLGSLGLAVAVGGYLVMRS